METLLKTESCRHFGVCGGCACDPARTPPAPAPYEDQLREKEARVRQLLSAFDIGEWRPLIPSPDRWYYRNKMELALAPAVVPPPPPRRKPSDPPLVPIGHPDRRIEGVVLGLREAGRFDRIVDLETCLLMSPEIEELFKRVRGWARAHHFTGYERRMHTGDLRYLVVREGKNTGDRMAVLISNSTVTMATHPEAFKELEAAIRPLATTAWLGVTDARGDAARCSDMTLLWGPGTIEERLDDIRYRISPYSFFQTNTRGAEQLYRLLAAWAKPIGGALVDLYCGSGGITLALARSFDRVVGIDTNREAITDAAHNAELNALKNTEFVCEDAMEFLKKLPGSKLAIQLSAMVVDPPRPGLHPKAMQTLLEMNPPQLAYVSCNPESLARDLQSLSPLYKINSIQLVDLFPNTPHVETVGLLEHR
jgi:23S rRNA (uracil1939-C5)-methyltransferase